MFKLENAIQQWRKSLTANPSLEDGYIAELEASLQDEVADLVQQGMSEEEAFRKVVSEMGQAEDIGSEFHKVYAVSPSGRPSWKPPRFVPALIWNSFKIAVRHFRRSKFYSSINITGMVVGIACCLLIFVYVLDELSYDAHHEKADRIYRIAHHGKNGERVFHKAAVSAPMGKALVENYPEVENSVRFRQINGCTISYHQKSFVENRIIFSDPEILEIFTLPLISGNPQTSLKEPYTLLMSERTAFKYFGVENPIGKAVTLNNRREYHVTGVFKEIPRKSHFHFDVILSMEGLEESKEKTWLPHNFNTYILLGENADPQNLEAKFPELLSKYLQPELKTFMGKEEWKKTESLIKSGDIQYSFYVQPLRDIHLHSDLAMELEPNSDIRYVQIFSLIAVFILIIAAINFINLSTARSTVRAKEVGLRKVVGASRGQLVRQFMLESLVFCFISLFLAFLLVYLSLPFFNHISGKDLARAELINVKILLAALVITLLACLIGGIYPAFFLSGFKQTTVLRGQFKSGGRGRVLRRILVVFQFSVSIVLIAWTYIVFSQIHYILSKKIGFDKEQVLILERTHLLGNRIDAFKREVLRNDRVKKAAVSGFLPIRPSSRNRVDIFPEGKFTIDSFQAQNWIVDSDFIPTLGMKIREGRNFPKSFSADGSAAIINQKAAEQLGWTDSIGRSIGVSVSRQGRVKMYTIIGMVEDFHFESFRFIIDPLVMLRGKNTTRMCLRIGTQDIQGTIDSIQAEWNRFAPGQPFEYAFLDERFNKMYQSERQTGKIIGLFSVLAVLIGGLGLSGLAAFITEQRTKEIGIRKTLGAKSAEVVIMICKDFIKPVAMANFFAWPVAYYAMNQWLQRFAYRIQIGAGVFVFAAAFTFIIALATVSWQAIRAGAADPIKSLRYE